MTHHSWQLTVWRYLEPWEYVTVIWDELWEYAIKMVDLLICFVTTNAQSCRIM